MGLLSCSKYQLMGSKGFRVGPPQIWFVSSHQAINRFTQEGSGHMCTAALLEGSLKATWLFSYKSNTLTVLSPFCESVRDSNLASPPTRPIHCFFCCFFLLLLSYVVQQRLCCQLLGNQVGLSPSVG